MRQRMDQHLRTLAAAIVDANDPIQLGLRLEMCDVGQRDLVPGRLPRSPSWHALAPLSPI
jgi:hypothetical protein